MESRSKKTHFGLGSAEVLTDPYFLIYCFVLSIVTLLECSVTMKLSELKQGLRGQKRFELLGVGLGNILAGFFGILPFSLSIGKNLLALRSGATSRIYLLLSAFFTILFGWLAWEYMRFLPMICVSIFNSSLGVLLINPELIFRY